MCETLLYSDLSQANVLKLCFFASYISSFLFCFFTFSFFYALLKSLVCGQHGYHLMLLATMLGYDIVGKYGKLINVQIFYFFFF